MTASAQDFVAHRPEFPDHALQYCSSDINPALKLVTIRVIRGLFGSCQLARATTVKLNVSYLSVPRRLFTVLTTPILTTS
jgi:hypothetical protein